MLSVFYYDEYLRTDMCGIDIVTTEDSLESNLVFILKINY